MAADVQPVLLVLSGPSGVGKTTVTRRLLLKNAGLTRVVTCTTRAPRDGEVNGEAYHFLSKAEFLRRVEADEFLEHAEVYGHYYGTLKAAVTGAISAGQDVLVVNDVQGALSFVGMARQNSALAEVMTTIFIVAENPAALRTRLESRGEDAPEVIAERLAVAEAEMAQRDHFDHVVVSSTREADAAAVQEIYLNTKKTNGGN